jgi:5-methylcytosine-specific restriction endonuclease McrA
VPIDYSRYPPNWKEIRAAILARAGNQCEFCGAANRQLHPITGSRVVLTIAHLDHDITVNDPERLRALCQRCHNQYDAPYRTANRRRTRETATGQLPFGVNE